MSEEEKRAEIRAYIHQRIMDLNAYLHDKECPECGRPFEAVAVKTGCCGRLIGWAEKKPLRRRKVSGR
jgi:hypothetical protein